MGALLFLFLTVAFALRLPVRKLENTPEQGALRVQLANERLDGTRPLRRVPKFDALARQLGATGTPIEPMENYYDEVWIGEVFVGTPSQGPFNVVLDTGSANFWIPSSVCQDKGCINKTKYDHTKSSTFRSANGQFFIPYGTGHVSGNLSYDTATLAGVNVTNDEFGEATGMAEFFEEYPIDGILGLAFDLITIPEGIPTVFDNMWSQGLLDANLFSVYLSDHEYTNESNIIFGGIDSKYVVPGSQWTYSLVKEPSYWAIRMGPTKVNGKITYNCPEPDGGCPVVVDTGTSIIGGPENEIQPMIDAIGTVNADCSNVNSLPNISFTIEGKDFVVPPQIYVIYETTDKGTTCLLGLEGLKAIEVGPLWILGDPFLRAYYSVYDKSTNPPRVGFAPAVQPDTQRY
eukprot:TRINITY_DN13017_c0_g1_i15.p1 TRINITY_DN13017_c0_g1~~TRINITY_DN13017_c0_g1_i15.p1  ORF type:complete len:403 (+),score=53.92 TRINITY_DN13017_c0_g1_i15:93-1301(+)